MTVISTTSKPSPSPPATPNTPRTPTSPLHLDLSTLPPPLTPSPPSNTLLITNLNDPAIFTAPFLQQLRTLLSEEAPLHSFAPLKSFRRVVVSFHTTADATAVRAALDGATLLGHRVRVYFGEPTPTDDRAVKHLAAPEADRLFFISPPPSPPAGWEMRNEEPPNKAVHAEDLASALAKLHAKPRADAAMAEGEEGGGDGKRRGSSTVVYRPDEHGGSPGLPAVMVEDTTQGHGEGDLEKEDERDARLKGMTHTARPPSEEADVS